jgi:hypothetical protein
MQYTRPQIVASASATSAILSGTPSKITSSNDGMNRPSVPAAYEADE